MQICGKPPYFGLEKANMLMVSQHDFHFRSPEPRRQRKSIGRPPASPARPEILEALVEFDDVRMVLAAFGENSLLVDFRFASEFHGKIHSLVKFSSGLGGQTPSSTNSCGRNFSPDRQEDRQRQPDTQKDSFGGNRPSRSKLWSQVWAPKIACENSRVVA